MSTDGFVIIPKHILQNSNLTPESIVLYAHLLHFDRGAKSKGCFCKRLTLSKVSGLSLHKLRKAISNLEENAIITVVRRRNSLTDIIRINPDCRHKLSTSSKSGSSCSSTKSRTSNTQEIKNFNPSSYKENKNTQVNKISRQDASNSVVVEELTENPTEITPKTGRQSTQVLKPYPILQPRTEVVRTQIRGVLRETTYLQYFSDISVVKEDNDCLTLHTPKGNLYKDFISNRFYDDLKEIVGKEICIVS